MKLMRQWRLRRIFWSSFGFRRCGVRGVERLFVLLDFGEPAITTFGLDFEGDGVISGTPYHGTWAFDAGFVPTVFVREGKGSSV